MPRFYFEEVVRWEEGKVVMIDQTKLPSRLTYHVCVDHTQVAEAIKKMVVRGAPAIGVAAAYGLALIAWYCKAKDKATLLQELEKGGESLKSARPTAVNLAQAVEAVLKEARATEGDVEEVKKAIIKKALSLAKEEVMMNHDMAKHGSTLIDDGDVVLTHCKWHSASRVRGPSPPFLTAQLWG